LLRAMVTAKPFHSTYQSYHGPLSRLTTDMRRSSHRHTTNQRIIEIIRHIRHETTGFEPTGHRPETNGACVNIASINPLSHCGSVSLTHIIKLFYWGQYFKLNYLKIKIS
jgi:hypothetical protein